MTTTTATTMTSMTSTTTTTLISMTSTTTISSMTSTTISTNESTTTNSQNITDNSTNSNNRFWNRICYDEPNDEYKIELTETTPFNDHSKWTGNCWGIWWVKIGEIGQWAIGKEDMSWIFYTSINNSHNATCPHEIDNWTDFGNLSVNVKCGVISW